MKHLLFNGKKIETDEEGYILNPSQWSQQLCHHMASIDHCEITEDHLKVINFLRQFHQQFDHTPAMRVLLKALTETLGQEKANSHYLYQLFPFGPAKQAARYAGLPKPRHCI